MDGRAPKAIITDQDRAMKAAIALVFPDTRHRYCLWHIMRKLPEKLGSHAAFNAGLKTAIQSALYDSQTCDEFEEKGGQLIQKYGLGENQWLQGLYNERSFWVPVYLKGVFWAGMSTTQRSESMNAFFDGFVHSGTTLKEFVDQFDNALRKKVEVETTADFNSSNQTIPCSSAFRIEKQFQAVYTNAKFKEVQREVWGMILCNCILIRKEGCIFTYDVLDEITTDDDHVKSIKYIVYFNDEEIDLKCTCALFEMRGIVCRHALNVYQMNKIHALPEKYLLDRWRKDLKRRYTVVKSSYDDLRQNADSRRYEFVVKRCVKLATRVSSSDAHVTTFMHHLEEFENQFKGLTLESGSTKVTETVVTDKGKKILSPHVVKGKERPPTKRKVPPVEKVATKRKKKQTRRKIFDDTNQNCEVSEAPENVEEQIPSVAKDDFVVLTQYSTVTQPMPSDNE
ncbi:protein FAR1-RELATED SEQUENCE 4-like [Juglans regia]|uniref:Protein FAR1-RELATED SEQUENCE n=1 Tax=Juglans regia TaxID=51240 RepID=A0A2I4E587_JUGRE|nr:protein FAR1-RELATED SEQUENCE 4-like [Juglans regia]